MIEDFTGILWWHNDFNEFDLSGLTAMQQNLLLCLLTQFQYAPDLRLKLAYEDIYCMTKEICRLRGRDGKTGISTVCARALQNLNPPANQAKWPGRKLFKTAEVLTNPNRGIVNVTFQILPEFRYLFDKTKLKILNRTTVKVSDFLTLKHLLPRGLYLALSEGWYKGEIKFTAEELFARLGLKGYTRNLLDELSECKGELLPFFPKLECISLGERTGEPGRPKTVGYMFRWDKKKKHS